jgi:hypothetical protein
VSSQPAIIARTGDPIAYSAQGSHGCTPWFPMKTAARLKIPIFTAINIFLEKAQNLQSNTI